MKVGRESVWLVVPFTVGIATVNYSLPLLYKHFFIAFATLFAAVAGLVLCVVATLKSDKRRNVAEKENDGDILEKLCVPVKLKSERAEFSEADLWRGRMILGATFFLAGVAVCVLANLSDLIETARLGADGILDGSGFVRVSRIQLFINGCGERFRNMLDGMPFGDSLSNALVKALLAGDRSGLSREVRNSFRAAGASHLLALSGLHLSVIYLVVSKILSVTGNSPTAVKVRSLLIILFSGFFTLITGASPSLMRAFLFITLRECAILTRRHTDGINIFCMSLMLQLALNPNDISSVGFQLSYLAMLGIFIINPPLERFWDIAGEWLGSLRKEKKTVNADYEEDMVDVVVVDADEEGNAVDGLEENAPQNGTSSLKNGAARMGTAFGGAMRKIWSLCTISISCQVFTAPAVLLYFSTFPTYFLLTNLLCLPLSNLLITLSVLATLLQIFNICPLFLLHIIDFLVHTLIYILDIISSM